MPHPPRQRILITGASSGLGEGMARRFAALGRDLALAARRTDRLDALKKELLDAHPGIRVEVAAMDVDDPESVATVVPEQILPDLPEIARRVGGLVLSGILAERGEEMLRAARGLGFAERARRTAGEWIAFYLEREA